MPELIDKALLDKIPAPTPYVVPAAQERDIIAPETPTGFLTRTGLAIEEFGPTANAIATLSRPFFPPVEGFDVTQFPELYESLPDTHRDNVQQSLSYEEAKWHSNNAQTSIDNMNKIMSGGAVTGGALMVAATIVDPMTLVAGAGELKAIANFASKGTRIARFLKGAAIGATSAAIIEAPLVANKEDYDAEDAFYGIVAGGVISGGLGLMAGRSDDIVRHVDDLQRETAKGTLNNLDERLVREASGETVEGVDNLRHDNYADDMMGREFDEVDDIEVPDAPDSDKLFSATGETTANQDNIRRKIVKDYEEGKIDADGFRESKIGKLMKAIGFSDYNRLYNSGSEAAVWFAHHLLESASGTGQRAKSAAVVKSLHERRLLRMAMPEFKDGYRRYAKEQGIDFKWADKRYFGEVREKFNRELALELNARRNADELGTLAEYVSENSAEINRLADKLQTMTDEALKLGQQSGIHGFKDIKRVAGYMPLVWKGAALRTMDKAKVGRYRNLLAKGYESMGYDPDIAQRVSKAVISRAVKDATGIDTNPQRMFSKDSRMMLEEILRDSETMTQDELDRIFLHIDTVAEKRGKASFARKRNSVDLTLRDNDIALMDIIDTDVETLMTRYAVEVSGRSALASKGIRSDADMQALRQVVIDNVQAKDRIGLDRITKTLDATYDQFLGRPVRGGVNRNARRLMDWATVSSLGMVGFAQTAEWAPVLAAHGVMNTMEQAPILRKWRKALKSGNFEDAGILGELDVHLGGMWDEHLLFRPEVRLNDAMPEDGTMLRAFDNMLASATDAVGYMSGMNQIKTMQQQFVATMQADKVFKALRKGNMDERVLKRFAEVGWDQKTLAKLRKKIDDGTVTFQANGALDRLNMEKWDARLIEDFGVGIHRHTNQIIQLGFIGEDAYWMHSTIGSLLTQFRKFPILAIEKQMGRQFRMNDPETYMQFVYGSALSTAVTLAKAAAMDVGTGESERLDKLLSPSGMVKAAMHYNGIMNVAPEFVSSVGNLLGVDALTSSGKARGFRMSATDVPALGAPIKAVQAASGLVQSALPWNERPLQKRDISNAIGSAFLGNIYPAVVGSNLLQRLGE